ncbi:hypothetical protein D3C86_2195460 [compost metagenome]
MEDYEDGTLLKVSESGFAHIPDVRQKEAYYMDSRGWEEQLSRLEQFLVENAKAREREGD